MTYRAFVDGQEGTTGLRIHEYLAQRADIEARPLLARVRDGLTRLLSPYL